MKTTTKNQTANKTNENRIANIVNELQSLRERKLEIEENMFTMWPIIDEELESEMLEITLRTEALGKELNHQETTIESIHGLLS